MLATVVAENSPRCLDSARQYESLVRNPCNSAPSHSRFHTNSTLTPSSNLNLCRSVTSQKSSKPPLTLPSLLATATTLHKISATLVGHRLCRHRSLNHLLDFTLRLSLQKISRSVSQSLHRSSAAPEDISTLRCSACPLCFTSPPPPSSSRPVPLPWTLCCSARPLLPNFPREGLASLVRDPFTDVRTSRLHICCSTSLPSSSVLVASDFQQFDPFSIFCTTMCIELCLRRFGRMHRPPSVPPQLSSSCYSLPFPRSSTSLLPARLPLLPKLVPSSASLTLLLLLFRFSLVSSIIFLAHQFLQSAPLFVPHSFDPRRASFLSCCWSYSGLASPRPLSTPAA